MSNEELEITIVGTLPPNKGISDTCLEQVRHLSDFVSIRFIDFENLYPERLYPGGSKEDAHNPGLPPGVRVEKRLCWYNPFGWLLAGVSVDTKVIHMHWWTYVLFAPLYTIALISKLKGKKIVCNVHNVVGHESHLLDRVCTSLFLKLVDTVICHSTANEQKLHSLFGIAKERIQLLPLGIPNYLIDKVDKGTAKEKLQIPGNKRIVLCFGNIRKYKGVDILLDAFCVAQKEVQDIHLVIAGKPWIDWKPYQAQIAALGLAELTTCYLDYVPTEQIRNYFCAADLLVLPYTHFDAQSGPGRIALGYGLPIIATDQGGLSDLVRHEQCLVYASSREEMVAELARKMIEILSGESLYKELLRGAEAKQNEFNWSTIANRTASLYRVLS